jgi:hypothetical protein
MNAYKFLRSGGLAPFAAVRWPRPDAAGPGEWLETSGVEMCRRGIHACALEDLPYWFQDELWEIELAGGVQRTGHKLAAPRGRLVRRVEGWDADAARSFSLACAERAAAIAANAPEMSGHAQDAAATSEAGKAAVTGYIVARAAELTGGVEAYEAERSAQVEWLAARLELATTAP